MKRLLILLLLIPCITFAQKTTLEKAEKHFKDYEYQEAITLYENIITADSSQLKVQERLAEAYRRIDQYAKAAYWYGKVVEGKDVNPIYFLYYGQMLLAQGDCESANYWNQKYLDKYPEEIYSFMSHPIDCDRFILRHQPQEDTTVFFIKKLPIINTKDDEIGLSFYNNTVLCTQKKKFIPPIIYDAWYVPTYELTNYQLSIDTIDLSKNLFDYTQEPIEWQQYKYNDSNFCITKDGHQAYFVRTQELEKTDTTIFNYKIFHVSWQKNKRQEITGLPFNSDEYNINYPNWVEEYSILYFASDMPGGFGGYDLYYSRLEDGIFSPPINLGPTINTEFDEIYPFLNATNQRLYFASNNEESLGGYDIFYSKIYENGYSKSIHLSAPINSEQDDLNFICNEKGTHGYFVSDRMGSEFKMDIYEFLKKEK